MNRDSKSGNKIMATSMIEKDLPQNEILSTEHNVEDYLIADDSAESLISWLKVKCFFGGKELELSIQHDCGSGYDIYALNGDETEDEGLREFLDANDVHEHLTACDNEYIESQKLEKFQESEDYDEIFSLSEKVASIAKTERDCLMLAKTLFESENIQINDTMIFLQINLDIDQKQSSDIVNLFL